MRLNSTNRRVQDRALRGIAHGKIILDILGLVEELGEFPETVDLLTRFNKISQILFDATSRFTKASIQFNYPLTGVSYEVKFQRGIFVSRFANDGIAEHTESPILNELPVDELHYLLMSLPALAERVLENQSDVVLVVGD